DVQAFMRWLLVFATDSVSPTNDAIGRSVGKQPLGPFRECRQRRYTVTGFGPRCFNGFQHDARAVFWRGFGLCTSARGVSQIRGVDPSVGSGLEFFLVRLRQVHCSTLDAGHDVAGLDENGVDAERIEFVTQGVA